MLMLTAAFTTDIGEAVRRSLPTVLHPSWVHQIAEIPRPGGKMDVAKFQALDLETGLFSLPSGA